MEIVQIPLNKLSNKGNVRKESGGVTFADLKANIADNGLLVPLTVRRSTESDKYFIKSGGRRYRALTRLKSEKRAVRGLSFDAIPCIIVDGDEETVSQADDIALQMAANMQRPLLMSRRGELYKQLMRDKHWPEQRISSTFGVKVSEIKLLIRLADDLPEIQKKVNRGEMSLTAYRAVVASPRSVRESVAEKEGTVTVRAARAEAQAVREKSNPEQSLIPDDHDLVVEINTLRQRLQEIAKMALSPRERFAFDQLRSTL